MGEFITVLEAYYACLATMSSEPDDAMKVAIMRAAIRNHKENE